MGLTRPRAHQLQDAVFKEACVAISTSNVTLSGGAPATVDGVSVAVADRILVTGQSSGAENGIYRVTVVGSGSNGTWVRTSDADSNDIKAGMSVMVTEGTTYADTVWKLTTDDPIIVGTTALTFERSSAYAFGTVTVDGTSLVADQVGDTLTISAGNNISYTSVTGTDTFTIAVADAPTFTGTLTYATLNDGTTDLTSTVAELNVLDGITATVSELNILDGVTATATELNYLDGVTGITLGSANELLVVGSDGTSIVSDSTLAVDTANNRVGINQTSPEVTLHMTGEGFGTAQIRMEQYNDTADAPDLRTRRYRGTIASPSAISSGDYLYRSNHEYWNGSALIVGGSFAFDNTNNANRTQFAVSVTTDGTSADPNNASKTQFKIDGNDSGAITFNNAYKFPTADGSANQVLQTDGSGALSFATVSTSAIDNVVEDTTPQLGGDLDLNSSDITGTGDVNITGTGTFTGNVTAGNLVTSGTVTLDRLSLSSSQTTVSPLQLTASSLNDGVGALRIDGAQADIFLNPDTATHTTVTFAVNDDQRLAFGMDSNSDFYITRRTGGSWYDDTLVIDRASGDVALGYTLTATGNVTGGNLITSALVSAATVTASGTITYGTLNDGTTDLTATVAELNILDGVTATATELNYVDGVTSAIQTQIDAKASLSGATFTGAVSGTDLTLSGNLTVNGTTTTVATTNMVVSDNLIELNNGAASNANDSGIVIERGSTGDNAIIAWDESADAFVMGTTTATGSSTGDLTITAGALSIGSLTLGGTAVTSTATELNLLDGVTGTLVTEAGTQTLTNKTLTTPVISSISNTGTLTLPTSTDTLVGRATTDTLTNKTLTSPTITSGTVATSLDMNGTELILDADGDTSITADTDDQIDFKIGGNDRITLSTGLIDIKNDGTQSEIRLYCESSNAHFAGIQAPAHAGFSGNVTVTLPAATTTLVGTDTTDTLTNKTLTTPVISSISNTGTLTLPTSTDTLVGRATTDTLTNKTLTSPTVGTNLDLSAQAPVQFYDSDSSNYVGIKAPGTVGSNVTFTLPASDGTNNQVLVTDGSGALSFADQSGGLADIVDDTTPQLGGNIDLNGFSITGTGNINITGTVTATGTQYVYTATASQTTFSGNDDNSNSLTYISGSVAVYQNGLLLKDTDDYTATNGTSVVLVTGALVNDVIQIIPLFGGGGGSSVDLSAVDQDIIPDADDTRSLGSASKQWADLFLAGGTMHLGGAKLQTDATTGAVAIIPKATANVPNPKGLVFASDGKVKPVTSTAGSISTSDFATAADSNDSSPSTAVYAAASDLPLSGVIAGTTAYVTATNRLYLWNGSGWYNIALVNTSPSITSGSPATVDLNTDGTATVLTLVATDPEDVPITWSYAVTSGSLTNGGGTTATVSQSDNVFTITPTTTEAYAGTFSITFSATDGVNTSTSVGAFTLAFAFTDTNFGSVVALYDASGVAGDNTTFVDGSSNSHSLTIAGNTRQISTSPYYYPAGYKSVYFDGSDDYLTYTASSVIPEPMAWLDGASDEGTIELWVKLDGTQTTPSAVNTAASFACVGATYINFGVTNTGALRYYYWTGTANYADSTTTLDPNGWNHIALVRSGTTIYFFINGSRDATSITSYAGISWGTGASGQVLYLGVGAGSPSNVYFKGHMSNMRFSDNQRYSGTTYTVPTAPFTSDSNTLLLTGQSNVKKDNSSNSYTLAVNSVPQVRNHYPDDFASMTTEYQPSNQVGSAYFDGSGDSITTPDDSSLELSNSDFTIEFWYKGTDSDQYATFISRTTATFASGMWTLMGSHTATGDLAFYMGDYNTGAPLILTSGVNVVNDEWHHVALVRSSSAFTIYVDGTSRGTGTSSATIADISGGITVGKDAYYGRDLSGYISDLRIVKGTAVYTSAFTPPTSALTAVSGTSLLLSFKNYALFERTGKQYVTTFNNNAEVTDGNYLHLRYASFFDGSGDYLTAATDTNRAIGTNEDFTLEAWVKVNAFSNYGHFATTYANVADDEDYFFRLNSTTQKWQFQAGSQNVTTTVSSTDLTLHKWHHLAVTRSSGSIYLWQDGVQVGGATSDTQSFNDNAVTIGRAVNGYDFNGYITDLRLVVGTAVYTSTFTPPTSALTAVSGTELLITSSASTAADASDNAATITATGTVSTTKEVDHNTNFSFGSDVDGTIKFKADTDYITVTNNEVMNLRDQDFTIDFWFKRDKVNSSTYGDTFICNVTSTGAIALAINPTGYTGVSYRNTATSAGSWTKVGTDPGDTYGSVQCGLNKWYHYACVRSGSNGYQFVNGVLAETFTFTGTISDWNGGMHFSHWHDSYTRGLIGEIFGFRITHGVARYTSSGFSVPTAPPGRRN